MPMRFRDDGKRDAAYNPNQRKTLELRIEWQMLKREMRRHRVPNIPRGGSGMSPDSWAAFLAAARQQLSDHINTTN